MMGNMIDPWVVCTILGYELLGAGKCMDNSGATPYHFRKVDTAGGGTTSNQWCEADCSSNSWCQAFQSKQSECALFVAPGYNPSKPMDFFTIHGSFEPVSQVNSDTKYACFKKVET
jgi:hypothetical protein